MSEQTAGDPGAAAGDPEAIRRAKANLHELAQLLRESGHLDPESQRRLAELVDEMGEMLAPASAPSAATAQLADDVAQLAQALHQQQEAQLISRIKQRLVEATARAEAEAPVATGVVQRLLDALAAMGI
jgi:hypothetical protein